MSDNNNRPSFAHLAYMLGLYSNKTIPQTYIGEFSNYELLLSLMNKVNEIIQRTTEYDDIMKEIQSLLDDIDDTIREDVERILNEMYEHGEFDTILENIFNDYFANVTAPKEFKIDTRREFRVALYSMPYDATSLNNLNYSYCQGGNYFEKSGVKYYVGCYRISSSDNDYYKNDNADIRLYIYLDGHWQFVRNAVYSVGHANDIRYIPHIDKFMVVKSAEFNGGTTETGSLDVCVIDWNLPAQIDATFTIPSELIYPERDRITCIDYYDNKYWILIGSGGPNPVQIYTCDIDSNYHISNFVEYAVFYLPYNAGTAYVMQGAGFCQNDDFIFIGNTAPQGIYRFNKSTHNIDCFYNIGAYTNYHMFPVGEVESLSLVDNNIYISTSLHGNQRCSYFDFNQVFSFDFVNGLTVANKVVTTYGSYNRIIYVGQENQPINVDYYTREISNPNGLIGKNGQAFPTWEELALFVNAQKLWTTLTVIPLTKNVAGYLALDLGSCNLYIDGYNYFSSSTATGADKYPRIAGVYAEGGSVDMQYVCIMNRAPEAKGNYAKYQIISRFGNFNIHNSYLFRYLRPEGSKLININRGFMNLGNILNYQDEVVTWNDSNLDAYVCSINTHNHWNGDTNYNIIN